MTEVNVTRKALLPVQSKALGDEQFEAWIKGSEPWRLLAVPFGGPFASPHSKKGVDLDGQFFSENTDIYGPYQALKTSRDRLVDFHHKRDEVMGSAVLAKGVLDPEPDEYGWWVDLWARRGEKRLELVRRLHERGVQLFGSTEPIGQGKADAETGEITYFPWLFVTLSPSPQNTLAVLRPKAVLDEIDDSPTLRVNEALRGLLAQLETDLPLTSANLPSWRRGPGDTAAKAEPIVDRLIAAYRRKGT